MGNQPGEVRSPAPQPALPGWPRTESPFHPGERAVQERLGMRERVERIGRRVIRDFMPDQHRELFEQLPFLLVGSLDEEGRPWASILTGAPGFIRSPDPRRLRIDAMPVEDDPLGRSLVPGAPVALLGIQLETRRRNRMNGTVTRLDKRGFEVRVGQSFGNCPQYIQARTPYFIERPGHNREVRARALGPELPDEVRELVRGADTFFIATAAPGAREGDPVRGVDISHRGGRPGFVRVTIEEGRTVLTAPDFRGNAHFNTLGNLELEPRAGLLFVDFDSGSVLALTGEAAVEWDGPLVRAFAGAERLLRFRVTDGLWFEAALPLRWSAPQPARQLEATGTWNEAERAIAPGDGTSLE